MKTKRTYVEDIYVNDYILKDGQLWDVIDINYVHSIGHVVSALCHETNTSKDFSNRTYKVLDKNDNSPWATYGSPANPNA